MPEKQPQVGQPRVGWLYDGNEETPHIGVAFSDSEDFGIQLSIPLRDVTGTYWQWFHNGSNGLFVGSDASTAQALPSVLQFHDAHGSVVLVGCRVAGWHSDFNVGTGRVGATYAVLGAHNLNYERVNGMRTVIPHLAMWMGAQITSTKTTTDSQGLVTGLTISTKSSDPIPVHPDGNLSLRGSFSAKTDRTSGTTVVTDHMTAETYWSTPETWEAHSHHHRALLDLLTIAAWQRFGFSAIEVIRDDDTQSGLAVPAARWLPVTTHSVPRPEEGKRLPQFLFTHRDIEIAALSKWIDLRRQHARAMVTFTQIPYLRATNFDSQLIQSSIALESLGYDLAQPNDLTNGQLKFRKALELVYESLGIDAVQDPEIWASSAAAVYRQIKHPDKPTPEVLEIINTLRDNITIMRCWVAIQLGIEPSELQSRLRNDRQAAARYEQA